MVARMDSASVGRRLMGGGLLGRSGDRPFTGGGPLRGQPPAKFLNASGVLGGESAARALAPAIIRRRRVGSVARTLMSDQRNPRDPRFLPTSSEWESTGKPGGFHGRGMAASAIAAALRPTVRGPCTRRTSRASSRPSDRRFASRARRARQTHAASRSPGRSWSRTQSRSGPRAREGGS